MRWWRVSAVILRGDARALPLPDASVDLIICSPPYWMLRDYQDDDTSMAGQIGAESTPWGYLGALWECTAEWVRVLKPAGSMFINLGDKYANRTRGAWRGSSDGLTWRGASPSYVRPKDLPEKSLIGLPWRYAIGCIDQLGLILRSEIIWDKPTPLPESVTDRVCRSHETWFHFTRQQQYFADLDAIREPLAAPRRKAGATAFGARDASIARTATGDYVGPNLRGKVPDTVWTIPAQPLRVPGGLDIDHKAAFPVEWPRRLILGWSPAGGLVVDPFGGTGTTALVADVFGRQGISVDRSADYGRLARWRTNDPGERARALGVAKPPPVMDGQLDMLGEAIA